MHICIALRDVWLWAARVHSALVLRLIIGCADKGSVRDPRDRTREVHAREGSRQRGERRGATDESIESTDEVVGASRRILRRIADRILRAVSEEGEALQHGDRTGVADRVSRLRGRIADQSCEK